MIDEVKRSDAKDRLDRYTTILSEQTRRRVLDDHQREEYYISKWWYRLWRYVIDSFGD